MGFYEKRNRELTRRQMAAPERIEKKQQRQQRQQRQLKVDSLGRVEVGEVMVNVPWMITFFFALSVGIFDLIYWLAIHQIPTNGLKILGLAILLAFITLCATGRNHHDPR